MTMSPAQVFTVTDKSIIDATVSVWKRGGISDNVFFGTVARWKSKGIVPVDWSPNNEGDKLENEVYEADKEC